MGNIFSSDSIKGGNYTSFMSKIKELIDKIKKGEDVGLFTGIKNLKKLMDPNITQEEASEISAKMLLSPFGQFCNDFLDNLDPKKSIRNKYFESGGFLKGNNNEEKKKNLIKFIYEIILGMLYTISQSSKSMFRKIFGSDEINDILSSDMSEDEKMNKFMETLASKSKCGGLDMFKEGGITGTEFALAVIIVVAYIVIYYLVVIAIIVIIVVLIIAVIAIIAIIAITIIVVVIVLVLLLIYICATLPILIYMMRDKNKISDQQHEFMKKYMKKYNEIVDSIFDLLKIALDSPEYITKIATDSIKSVEVIGDRFVKGAFAALSQYLTFMTEYTKLIGGVESDIDSINLDDPSNIKSDLTNKLTNMTSNITTDDLQSSIHELTEKKYLESESATKYLNGLNWSDIVDTVNDQSENMNKILNKWFSNSNIDVLFDSSKRRMIQYNDKLIDLTTKSSNSFTDALLMYIVFLILNIGALQEYLRNIFTTGKLSSETLKPGNLYTSDKYTETYEMIKKDIQFVIDTIFKF